jgi:hypothetical protein
MCRLLTEEPVEMGLAPQAEEGLTQWAALLRAFGGEEISPSFAHRQLCPRA